MFGLRRFQLPRYLRPPHLRAKFPPETLHKITPIYATLIMSSKECPNPIRIRAFASPLHLLKEEIFYFSFFSKTTQIL
jgi:hypothetical protein